MLTSAFNNSSPLKSSLDGMLIGKLQIIVAVILPVSSVRSFVSSLPISVCKLQNIRVDRENKTRMLLKTAYRMTGLKPQDSFSRFAKIIIDLQKVDHTIRKHH